MYYSESGLDQVYAIVGGYIDDALVEADRLTSLDIEAKQAAMMVMLEQFSDDTAAIMADDDLKEAYYDIYKLIFGETSLDGITIGEFVSKGLYIKALLYNEPEYDDYAQTFLRLEAEGEADEIDVEQIETLGVIPDTKLLLTTDHRLIVDTDEIVEYSKRQLNTHYKEYLNPIMASADFETKIDNLYVYLDDASSGSQVDLEFDGVQPFVVAEQDEDFRTIGNELVLQNVQSTFNYKGLTRKSVETNVVIKAPTDIVPLNLAQNKVVVKSNPLWQYALITEMICISTG